MRGFALTRRCATSAAALFCALAPLPAQETPAPGGDSFDVEPPLLVQPSAPEAEPGDAGQLAQQLVRAQKSAASAAHLVGMGVLAKTEAEQRALRVVRLEAALADAQLRAAQTQVATLQASASTAPAELQAAIQAATQADTAAQAAAENYQRARLAAAELDLRRQRQLLALGSAHRSDVARAEEKLDRLQRGDDAPAR